MHPISLWHIAPPRGAPPFPLIALASAKPINLTSRFVRFAESRFHLPRINQDASKLAEAMALIKTKRPDLEFFSPNDVIIEWNQRLGEGGFCTAYRAVWRGTSRLSNRLVPGCESSQRKTHTGVSKSRQAGSPFLL